MKKWKVGLSALVCVLTMGCSNEFAKQEYDSVEKIANWRKIKRLKSNFLLPCRRGRQISSN